MTNTALLCMGSNTPDSRLRLSSALSQLRAEVEILRTSDILKSADISGLGSPYLNQIIEIATPLTSDQLRTLIHQIEQAAGRTPQSKASGKMPLDIDIISWNTQILSPKNHAQPYIQTLLPTLQKTP